MSHVAHSNLAFYTLLSVNLSNLHQSCAIVIRLPTSTYIFFPYFVSKGDIVHAVVSSDGQGKAFKTNLFTVIVPCLYFELDRYY